MTVNNIKSTQVFEVLNKSKLPHRHFIDKALKAAGDKLRQAYKTDEQILIKRAHDSINKMWYVPNRNTIINLTEISNDKITVTIEHFEKG